MFIERYKSKHFEIWNKFIAKSKNGIFMFNRNFMDYHKDRFKDHSLLFFKENNLVAVLGMSEHDNELISHGGLTYGGFIVDDNMKQHIMNDCFELLIQYAKINNYNTIYYKRIPHIFCKQVSEEDRYSLFLKKANLVRIEPATVINLKNPLKMTKGRKAQISRARREGVIVKEIIGNEGYLKFMDLENEVLSKYHNTKAVHSGEEISLLAARFPDNIKLFGAFFDNKMIAGSVVFEYDEVVHTQYLAANDFARRIGALDLVIFILMEKYKFNKKWLDFGISTENNGLVLNEGLIAQKEGFGGRSCTYEMWKIDI